ncbi:hypothetical protein [Aliivibrio kagoshimensis]|uniref:hypothetical protein n=1 Tax=Aliivibrio kagoshimensis TaxID=2910230 RepID=UPI003D09F41C
MKKLILLFTLLPFAVVAKVVSVEATGYGVDIRSATKDALVSAISQTNNSTITTNQKSSLNELTKNSDSSLQTSMNDDFTLSANGVVKKYSIKSEHCDNGQCVVKILAQVKESKEGILDGLKRKKMSIKSFNGNHSGIFNSGVEESFTRGGGKFAIIDKGIDEQMDYIIEISLVQSKTRTWKTDNRTTDPLTGEVSGKVSTKYSSVYEVKYRVLSGATSQVKYANSQKSTSGRSNLALLAEITASKVYKDINDAIFPMRIASIYPAENRIAIPTDGKAIKVGSVFKVESAGSAERDPYTGEIIGYRTTKVGEIKINHVERKVMYGSVIKGDINQMKPKMIIKPIVVKVAKKKPVVTKKSKPKVVDESVVDEDFGGVIL